MAIVLAVCGWVCQLDATAQERSRQVQDTAPNRALRQAAATRDGFIRIATAPRVQIEPVRIGELVGLNTKGGLGAALATHELGLSVPPVQTRLARRLDNVWKLELPTRRLADVQIEYALIGDDGRPGHLSLSGAPGESIPVQVESLPGGARERSGKRTRMVGGAVLYLDLSELRVSGEYSGTLLVTVNGL